MERFVELIVAGGLALVAGLWLVEFTEFSSLPWILGVALSLLGVGGLARGIWSEVDVAEN
ncbi:MAG: hypothetical protein SXQ77_05165 [Halobacteria archaeon]|nr:hypothetical protein [Halobacteria archaeon]